MSPLAVLVVAVLAVDVASFTNVDPQFALEALLAGEPVPAGAPGDWDRSTG